MTSSPEARLRPPQTTLSATSCSSWSIRRSTFDATVQDGTVLVKDFVNLTQDADHNDVADVAENHVRKVGLFEGVDDYGRVTPMLGKAEAGSIIMDKMSDDSLRGMRRRPKSRSWAQLSSGTCSTSRRIATRSIFTSRSSRSWRRAHRLP